MNIRNVGKNLKKLRCEAMLSQQELAKQLTITQANICRWENGRHTPSIDSVIKIAQFFGVTVDKLLNNE